MFALQKSSKKASSRRQINIKGVRDNVLLLPKNEFRAVLEVSSLNFELKSEDEQDALIDIYESFLNSLPCQIQILVRIRELDMTKYLTDLHVRLEDEQDEIYRDQLTNYGDFVSELVADNSILSRHFYIVVPYGAKNSDFESAKEQLQIHSDIISKGLMRLGMHTRRLTNLEMLDLFHSFYNPVQAKNQPITESVIRLVTSSYTRGERA